MHHVTPLANIPFSRGANYKCYLLIVVISFVVSELSIGSQVCSLPTANIIGTHQGRVCLGPFKIRFAAISRESRKNTRQTPCENRLFFPQPKIERAITFLCRRVEAIVAISHRVVATSRSPNTTKDSPFEVSIANKERNSQYLHDDFLLIQARDKAPWFVSSWKVKPCHLGIT